MNYFFKGTSQDLLISQNINLNNGNLNFQNNQLCYDNYLSQIGYQGTSTPTLSLDLNSTFFVGPDSNQDNNKDNYDLIWCSEYAEDIVKSLNEAERKRRDFHSKSPQKAFRSSLIQVIKHSSVKLGLGRTTVHLAVYFLDTFMDNYIVIERKLNIVALTCLALAAKIEEKESNVPKLKRLSQFLNNGASEFKTTEIKLLQFFGWDLLYPTCATYLEHFLSNFLSKNDIKYLLYTKKLFYKNETAIIEESNSILFEILDLILQDQNLCQGKPSKVAAACLALTRSILGAERWNEEMFLLTGCKFYDFEKIYNSLLLLKRNKDIEEKNKNTPDSGFVPSSDEDDYSSVEEDNYISYSHKRRRIE